MSYLNDWITGRTIHVKNEDNSTSPPLDLHRPIVTVPGGRPATLVGTTSKGLHVFEVPGDSYLVVVEQDGTPTGGSAQLVRNATEEETLITQLRESLAEAVRIIMTEEQSNADARLFCNHYHNHPELHKQ